MRPGAPTACTPTIRGSPETLFKERDGSTEHSLRTLDKETKIQREEVTYPRSHSDLELKMGYQPGDSQFSALPATFPGCPAGQVPSVLSWAVRLGEDIPHILGLDEHLSSSVQTQRGSIHPPGTGARTAASALFILLLEPRGAVSENSSLSLTVLY